MNLNREQVQEVMNKYPDSRSAIMPLLHRAQAERGHLAREDFTEIAELLGLTPAYVESVASFYTLYHRERVGRYIITVCTNLPCALAGADELVASLSEKLGVAPGETTEDGLFTLEATHECLAACDLAPVAQVNLEYRAPLTANGVDDFIADLRAQAEQEADREDSEPMRLSVAPPHSHERSEG